MMYKIDEIEGIGTVNREKLATASIATTEDLLKFCCDAKGRQKVADKTGLSTKQVLKWANMADLMRISGIGSEYSELLEASGVDTIKELRHRKAEHLAKKMRQVNEEKNLTRAVPSESQISKWIDQASSLEPLISH